MHVNFESENTLDANGNVFNQEYSYEGINEPLHHVPLDHAWHQSVFLDPFGEMLVENIIMANMVKTTTWLVAALQMVNVSRGQGATTILQTLAPHLIMINIIPYFHL